MLKAVLFLSFAFSIVPVFSQTGPGGVGTTNGTSSLVAWYRSDDGVILSGTVVTGLTNAAGYAALNMSETVALGPTISLASQNGYNMMYFNGTNRLVTGLTLTAANFIENQATTFSILKPNTVTQIPAIYTTDPLAGMRFSAHLPWNNVVYYDMGACCSASSRISFAAPANILNCNIWGYSASAANGKRVYENGQLLASLAGVSAYSGYATQRFNLGGHTSGVNGMQGYIGEVIVFKEDINTAQQIIVNNYLAAKFGLALAVNDLYVQDNPGNGDFDHDVAGIGQVSSTGNQLNSRGTGMVRISNATGLEDNEYYIWGHNNFAAQAGEIADVPAGIEARLLRVWRGSEVNASGTAVDVGAVDIEFDLSNLGAVSETYLRLLIDLNNNGIFADDAPVTGAVDAGSGRYIFSGVTGLANELRFTLGTTDKVVTPLPVDLVAFEVKKMERQAEASWEVSYEEDIISYKIHRTADFGSWELVGSVPAQGQTRYQLSDPAPLEGVSYYRLSTIDDDHVFNQLGIRSVEFEKGPAGLSVFPNPANNEFLVTLNKSERDQLIMVDQFGKNITGFLNMQWVSDDQLLVKTGELAAGVYYLQTPSASARVVLIK